MPTKIKSCHLFVSAGFPETDFFSKALCEKLDLQFVRVGELFRTLYKSDEGYKIKQFKEKGLSVPSSVTAEIIEARFGNESKNVLLQGFPKDEEEMGLLLALLHKHHFQLSGLWYFKIQDLDQYVLDMKGRDDLYIQKFGINEPRIRSQAETSEAMFKNLAGLGVMRTPSYLLEVDSRKQYSKKEVEDLIGNRPAR